MMKTNKRLFRNISILIVTALFLGACSGGGGPAPAEATTPLRVSWSLWPGYYPMAIALEKGMFEKHGVRVEGVFYSSYLNQLPDLASGMIDGAMLTLSDTMFDSVSGTSKVVFVVDSSAGADHIVTGPNVSDIQDLRGKRIGISPSTVSGALLIRQMLANNGIEPTEVTFVDVPPEGVPSAIPQLIDAGYTYDPYTSTAIARGGKIVFSSADAPGLIVDVLAFRNEIVNDRPGDVQAFIDAWGEALEYWQQNPEDAHAIIAKAVGLKPEEISSEGVDLFDLQANQTAFIPGTTSVSVYYTAQNALTYLTNTGDVTKPVDINQLLDPSFLK